MNNEAFGVDIGNVIIEHRYITDADDESIWNEKYHLLPEVSGVMESLKALNDKFNGRIFLVSKLREEHDSRTLRWLKKNKFFEKTGIDPKNIIFCRNRSDKVNICLEKDIKHFVDDRLEVLGHMVGKVPNLFLFNPNQDEVENFKQFLSEVNLVKNWSEIMEKML